MDNKKFTHMNTLKIIQELVGSYNWTLNEYSQINPKFLVASSQNRDDAFFDLTMIQRMGRLSDKGAILRRLWMCHRKENEIIMHVELVHGNDILLKVEQMLLLFDSKETGDEDEPYEYVYIGESEIAHRIERMVDDLNKLAVKEISKDNF